MLITYGLIKFVTLRVTSPWTWNNEKGLEKDYTGYSVVLGMKEVRRHEQGLAARDSPEDCAGSEP